MNSRNLGKYLRFAIEFALLVIVIQFSLTNGFTNSLNESLGLNGNSSALWQTMFGSPDITKLIIATVVGVLVFSLLILFKKKK